MSPRHRLARSDEEHRRQEREYADAHVDAYHREMHQGPWPTYRRRLEERVFAYLGEPTRVLDVGAGPVPSLLGVLEKAEEYVAMDQSEACVRRMQVEYPRVDARVGDAELLPVEGPFDLVLMLGVLHHLPHPARAVARGRDLLRVGGILVSMEPNELTESFMDSPNEQGIADPDFEALFDGMEVLERWAWFDVGFWSRLLGSRPGLRWERPEEWVQVVEQEMEGLKLGARGSMNFCLARKRQESVTS